MKNESPTPLHWFKSSYSGDEGGECVEVASGKAQTHVRDSKDRCSPELAFAQGVWTDFVVHVSAI